MADVQGRHGLLLRGEEPLSAFRRFLGRGCPHEGEWVQYLVD